MFTNANSEYDCIPANDQTSQKFLHGLRRSGSPGPNWPLPTAVSGLGVGELENMWRAVSIVSENSLFGAGLSHGGREGKRTKEKVLQPD